MTYQINCPVSPSGEPETPLTVIELGPCDGTVTRTPQYFDRDLVEATLYGSYLASFSLQERFQWLRSAGPACRPW